jgi:integrase/recombinase XerD
VKPVESAFQSALAPWLRDFVLEKHAVGYRYASEQQLLQRLDRHLLETGHKEANLPRAVLDAWLAKTAHEHPKTQAARVSVVRQLARFLQSHGVLVELPPAPPRRLQGNRFLARIFSPEEMTRLLAAIDKIPVDGRAPHRHLVMPALFRVLYACGLRVGEALRLRIGDVDLDQGVFTIRQGKFRKDRLVPMSPSLQAYLRRYHTGMGKRASDAIFFAAPHGGVYSLHAPYSTFRWMLRAAKIAHGGRGKGPRVHDLRHTFAVRRLEAWYRERADLNAKLPVLSTYLGHESLVGTQRYLQLTAELYPDLSKLLEEHFGALIPRGGEA